MDEADERVKSDERDIADERIIEETYFIMPADGPYHDRVKTYFRMFYEKPTGTPAEILDSKLSITEEEVRAIMLKTMMKIADVMSDRKDEHDVGRAIAAFDSMGTALHQFETSFSLKNEKKRMRSD